MKMLFAFFTALMLASSAQAAGSTVYDKAAFKRALDTAVGKIYKNHGGKAGFTLESAGGQVTHDDISNGAAGGMWRIGLGNACEMLGTNNSASNEYGKLMRYNSPGVATNNGSAFAYAFQTQAVEDGQLPYVEKRIAARKKSLMSEYKDVQVSLERQPNKAFLLTAGYSYANGVSESNIADRLYYFMRESEWLLCDVHTGFELYNADRWSNMKGNLTTVSKSDFVMLYPYFKESGYEVNNPSNPYGDWQMKGDGFHVWVENQNTQMKLWVRIRKTLNQAQKAKDDAVVEQLRAIEPSKGASSAEVYRDANDFWIGSVYPYQTLKGKEIEDTVNYFYNKYAPGAYKKAKKIIDQGLK